MLVFGYYNMAGYISQAVGAIFAGLFIDVSVNSYYFRKEDAITNVVRIYALFGALKYIGYVMMNRDSVEAKQLKENKIVTCSGIRK